MTEWTHNFDELVNRRGTDAKKYSEEYYPQDVIPMWIADTDFKAPKQVTDALQKRVDHGIFGYTVTSQRLRRAVKGWERQRFGYEIRESDVEYVFGVISGIICTIRALSRPGDKIILQTPAYPPFSAAIRNNGRQISENPLILGNGRYEIDFDGFERLCKDPLTRLFILCNPQNPTGRVFAKEELQRLGEICIRHKVIVISDEIHCDLTYPGHTHIPFGKLSSVFAQNSVMFINPSKTFNVSGLRTGAMICTNQELKERIHQVIVSNKAVGENVFGTLALCVAYEECAYYADQLNAYLEENLRYVRTQLADIPQIRLIEPEGTFLLWLDCRAMGLSQDELMKLMVNRAKVGAQSGTDFGEEGRGFLRLNIGCPRNTLETVMHRLKETISDYI